jgi:hypothetical protein
MTSTMATPSTSPEGEMTSNEDTTEEVVASNHNDAQETSSVNDVHATNAPVSSKTTITTAQQRLQGVCGSFRY